MYTGLFGAKRPDDDEFGNLVETTLFAQRFHEGARLNYARKNQLKLVWASTRGQFGEAAVEDAIVQQWPVAVLAFHYGASAACGRLADFDARVHHISLRRDYSA